MSGTCEALVEPNKKMTDCNNWSLRRIGDKNGFIKVFVRNRSEGMRTSMGYINNWMNNNPRALTFYKGVRND